MNTRLLPTPEWKRHSDRSTSAILKAASVEVKGASGNPLALRFTISDSGLDRDGDTIDVNGWKLDEYAKNPVILWGHGSHNPPVGKSEKVWVKDGSLMSIAVPVPEDIQDPRGFGFGASMFRLYREGFLKAVSVGFMPLKFKDAEDRDGFMPVDFLEQELLEYSLVPVPSNPRALLDAAKSGHNIRLITDWAEGIVTDRLATTEAAESLLASADDKHKVISIPNTPDTAEDIDMEELEKLRLQVDEFAKQNAELLERLVALESDKARISDEIKEEEEIRGLIRATVQHLTSARTGEE